MIPRPGLALIRRPAIADTIPGGRIVLTENTREFLTLGQAELVSMGREAAPEDRTWANEEDHCWEELARVPVGAWLLVAHRTWIPTDTDDIYLIRHEDILGVFR